MDNMGNDLLRADGPALLGRRQVLKAGIALATASLLPRNVALAQGREGQPTTEASRTLGGHRRLGSLEVSSVGLGVQNMSRT